MVSTYMIFWAWLFYEIINNGTFSTKVYWEFCNNHFQAASLSSHIFNLFFYQLKRPRQRECISYKYF